MTSQRSVILEELRKVRTHPTADELYERVRRRMPRISIATVYRNLEILCQSGEVSKLEMAGHQRRYDGVSDGHLHARCTGCGRVCDLEHPPEVTFSTDVADLADFTVTGYRLEFTGFCPSCREGTSSSR